MKRSYNNSALDQKQRKESPGLTHKHINHDERTSPDAAFRSPRPVLSRTPRHRGDLSPLDFLDNWCVQRRVEKKDSKDENYKKNKIEAQRPPVAKTYNRLYTSPLRRVLSPAREPSKRKTTGLPPKTPVPTSPPRRPYITEFADSVYNSSARGISEYEFKSPLGQGAFSAVRLAVHRTTGKTVAVKTYEKRNLLEIHRKNSVTQEINVLRKLKHPNVIELYETINSQAGLHLVMEYIGGCDLRGFLKRKYNRRVPEQECIGIYRQLVQSIHYCHSANVTHRDIKLENIIIDDKKNIKLIDFGFATCHPHSRKTSLYCGTISYMAPEILQRKEYSGPPVDIWALGVLLYVLLCGHFPFKGMSNSDLLWRISRGVYVVPDHIAPRAKLLLGKMLRVDPDLRISSREVLEDQWLNCASSGNAPEDFSCEKGSLKGASYNADLIDMEWRMKNSGSQRHLSQEKKGSEMGMMKNHISAGIGQN